MCLFLHIGNPLGEFGLDVSRCFLASLLDVGVLILAERDITLGPALLFRHVGYICFWRQFAARDFSVCSTASSRDALYDCFLRASLLCGWLSRYLLYLRRRLPSFSAVLGVVGVLTKLSLLIVVVFPCLGEDPYSSSSLFRSGVPLAGVVRASAWACGASGGFSALGLQGLNRLA